MRCARAIQYKVLSDARSLSATAPIIGVWASVPPSHGADYGSTESTVANTVDARYEGGRVHPCRACRQKVASKAVGPSSQWRSKRWMRWGGARAGRGSGDPWANRGAAGSVPPCWRVQSARGAAAARHTGGTEAHRTQTSVASDPPRDTHPGDVVVHRSARRQTCAIRWRALLQALQTPRTPPRLRVFVLSWPTS